MKKCTSKHSDEDVDGNRSQCHIQPQSSSGGKKAAGTRHRQPRSRAQNNTLALEEAALQRLRASTRQGKVRWHKALEQLKATQQTLRDKQEHLKRQQALHAHEIKVLQERVNATKCRLAKRRSEGGKEEEVDEEEGGDMEARKLREKYKLEEEQALKSLRDMKVYCQQVHAKHRHQVRKFKKASRRAIVKRAQDLCVDADRASTLLDEALSRLRREREQQVASAIQQTRVRAKRDVERFTSHIDYMVDTVNARYNEQTKPRSELIVSLKKTIGEMSQQAHEDDRARIIEKERQLIALQQRLAQLRDEAAHMKNKLAKVRRRRQALEACQAQLLVLRDQQRRELSMCTLWERRLLEIKKERDDLRQQFEGAFRTRNKSK